MASLRFPRLIRVRIVGQSMSPTLNDGDWTLFLATHGRNARTGSIILVQRDLHDFIQVKRIKRVSGDGSLWVEGDNSEASTDSRTWGAVPPDAVRGKFLLRYRKARN